MPAIICRLCSSYNVQYLVATSNSLTKHDINEEVDISSKTLKLVRNNGLVFHRDNVTDQVTVTRKALAYAEVIITNNCRNAAAKRSVSERRGKSVMAYLDTLSRRNVMHLQKDTSEALDNMKDTRRSMTGDDLQDRIREFSFTADGNRLQLKAPHTHADISERLHERLFAVLQSTLYSNGVLLC